MSEPEKYTVEIPLRTKTLNRTLRSHWRVWSRLAKHHRETTYVAMWNALRIVDLSGAWEITLQRIAPRPLDDDNLAGAMKAIRDGIADFLGTSDNNPLLKWKYDQARGKPKQYTVFVYMRRRV